MRTHVLAGAMLLFAVAAHAADGFNAPGFDYDRFEAASPAICRNSCAGDPYCLTWAWVKPGIQGPGGQCWLKSREVESVRNACCSLGQAKHIEQRQLKPEKHTNRPGLDYRHFETDAVKECETACVRDDECTAWTHVLRGVQGPRGLCWLKSVAAHPVPDLNATSGVKLRPRAIRLADPVLVPASN